MKTVFHMFHSPTQNFEIHESEEPVQLRDGIEPRLGSKARRLEAIFARLEKLDARLEIFEPRVAGILRPK